MEAGDEALRELERAAGQGDPEADGRYLAAVERRFGSNGPEHLEARARIGRIGRERLELAARLGSLIAARALGVPAAEPLRLEEWLEVAAAGDALLGYRESREVTLSASLALLERLVPEGSEERTLQREALELGRARLACARCYVGACEHAEWAQLVLEQVTDVGGAIGSFAGLIAFEVPDLQSLGAWRASLSALDGERWADFRGRFLDRLLDQPPATCAECDLPVDGEPLRCNSCEAAFHPRCLLGHVDEQTAWCPTTVWSRFAPSARSGRSSTSLSPSRSRPSWGDASRARARSPRTGSDSSKTSAPWARAPSPASA